MVQSPHICASVEVEMWNREICIKYVKDDEAGWSPVLRRRKKKSDKGEDGDDSGNSNILDQRKEKFDDVQGGQ